MKRVKGCFWIIGLGLFFILLTGCAGHYDEAALEQDDAVSTQESKQGTIEATEQKEQIKTQTDNEDEPVKLLFGQKWSEITEEDFQTYIVEPLQREHPHIELEYLHGENFQERIAAGQVPDLIAIWVNLLPDFQDLDLVDDMMPLIKKHNMDLDRFEPAYIDTIRNYSPEGGLVALPYDQNFNLIYYNKDIFDNFGVAYPKDGMTWQETLDLARQVTRESDGVNYRGLEAGGHGKLALQLGLQSVKNGKANVNNEEWKRMLQLTRDIEAIPGNEGIPDIHPRNQFIAERNLAMFATGYNFNLLSSEGASDLNWDIAQYPSYEDYPDLAGIVDEHVIFVTKTSKHKDEAFKAIEVLVSDEIQTLMTRKSGKLSVLKKEEVKHSLGLDMPVLEGKNLEAIFKSYYLPAYTAENYDPEVDQAFNEEAARAVSGEIDVNTALRNAEERMNAILEADLRKR